MLFSTNKVYEDKIFAVKKGDILFLLNLDSNTLYGTFRAKSDGRKNIVPEAWGGGYPFQVEVEKNGEINTITNAATILSKLGISWKIVLDEDKTKLLTTYVMNPNRFAWGDLVHEIRGRKGNGKTLASEKYDVYEKPKLESTTLWDYPRQSYGKTPKGNNKYAGVTPAFIIYNLVKRYTEPNDLVVDPMAGSGTTVDVCREEGRRCIAYDIVPASPNVVSNDARKIPLDDKSVDLVFIDSPYGDNIAYNTHEKNIGRISAEADEFYQDLEKVMSECYRILKPGKVLGWLIGDQWVKKKFTPVGFNIYQGLCKNFETLDIICVARRSQTSNTGIWYNRALRFNFYLRGFKYLFIMKKPEPKLKVQRKRIVRWSKYSRSKTMVT
jgi:DNA modification methylase